jgi:hypothetical protein
MCVCVCTGLETHIGAGDLLSGCRIYHTQSTVRATISAEPCADTVMGTESQSRRHSALLILYSFVVQVLLFAFIY